MSVEITKIDFKKISLVQCLGLIMLLLLFVVVFIDFKGFAQSVSDMLEQHREEESNEDDEDLESESNQEKQEDNKEGFVNFNESPYSKQFNSYENAFKTEIGGSYEQKQGKIKSEYNSINCETGLSCNTIDGSDNVVTPASENTKNGLPNLMSEWGTLLDSNIIRAISQFKLDPRKLDVDLESSYPNLLKIMYLNQMAELKKNLSQIINLDI